MEKKEALLSKVSESVENGADELSIKILRDGFLITETRVVQNPTRSQIEDAVGNTVLYEFGGIEVHQGQCRILRLTRKIKI